MKKNTYKVLLTDNDFLMAALTQSEVSVWYKRDPDPVGQIRTVVALWRDIRLSQLRLVGRGLFSNGLNLGLLIVESISLMIVNEITS